MQLELEAVEQPRDRHAHRPVRDGVPHAGVGAGADRPVEGARAHLRAVRPGRAQAGHLRRQLPAGPPAGRARRALHPALSPRLGPARDAAAQHPRRSAARPTSRRRRWSGPEAARPARRHAGRLGRRVRPHRLLPGQADGRRTTAATTTRAASRSGWPAAASSPASASARPTTLATTSSTTRSTSTTSTRPSCTAWASTTRG